MHDDRNPPRYTINDNWPDAFGTMHWDTTPGWGESSSGKGDVNAWGASSATNKVEIDGRNFEEEENWWDAARRAECKRPGPGVLPPLLSELLHNPEHTLYSVSASLPKHSHSNSTSSTSSGSSQSQSTIHHPPSAEEVRKAVPHANAYYCKEHNGWVLLSWCSSTVLPPFARSFNPSSPLPDQARRKRTQSCVGEGEQPFGQANKTHHFHKYERAVDARMLNTPFKRSEWEEEELLKRRRRKMTLHEETMDTSVKVPQVEDEVEGDLLDLYVCCQCSVYCLASQVIPGVIPVKYVEDLTKDKLSHPSLDKTAHASVLSAWETIITILQNRIFKGENRVLPVTGAKFQSKIGWTPVIRQIFEQLGFPLRPLVPSEEQPQTLQPPEIDPSTPAGRRMRGKLLRAWVEVCAYTIIFQKSKSSTSFGNYDAQKLSVTVESAREMYQTGIGAHVNQIPRGLLPDNLLGCTDLNDVWEGLGMTPSSYSHDLVTFAYLAQCRCDPANTPTYFGHLHKLHEVMKTTGVPSSAREEIEMLLLQEKSRGRWSKEDLKRGAAVLGFGLDNALGVDLDDEVDEEFILRAWKDGLKRSWTMEDGNERRMQLYDALKILSELKSSKRLLDAWTHEKGSGMSPDAAYLALQVSKEVEDDMLITVYTFAVQDQPSQIEKMRNALTVIAESRDSQRLRGFLETGVDPGDVVQQVKMDMPRGLNQLGNTCYLNSLLQYFYTIKDLREAVTPLAATDFKTLEEKKLSDDDLKRHRVGGRLVTRREILRSKKFVNQLAELFWNLEYSEIPAVTPTMDLAKLALVTSQDEEEDDQCGTATDASNDTDATLVDDGPLPSRTQERSNSASPVVMSPGSMSDGSSVLGKRTRTDGPMDVDMDSAVDKGKDSYVVVEKPEASSSKGKAGHSGSAEVEMVEDVSKPQPPALPPRKPREVDDSVMMFGRQHDVSECMDNCMFQIETALLDFHEMAGTEDDKTSVVKRLFYGKKRQRLAPLDASEGAVSRYSVHEKEDLFSHLHVNVSEEGYDLYDGLSRYFDDVVEFEGVKRRMEVTLVDLPPLLQIQLQRVQFDRETQQAYKSQAYVKFGETIYLDRFMDTAAPEKKARAKAIQTRLNACRDRIYKLTQGKHAPFAPALGGVADFLEKQDALRLEEVDDDFIAVIKAEKDHVSAVLEQERAEAGKLKEELEAVWKDDVSSPYELTSVFIHRGASPSWGHYFFYSRHLPDKPDSWFKYNDSDVSIVPKEEVLADTTGSTANPYMLVFTRKDSDVVHTVHRFDADQLQDA
ncbi:cysteine proteinase [Cristinia sonorae]|uniref:ubiquitinyl hydrolase 1 n=1 Tax=Cristinia sonorae TaxID=1940300 RepID=A0A8K0UM30_9AGAR|nr:cysteine proteinase [Cristinia sonorae]